MKSKVGIADAFGTLVEVGDTVVYKSKQKYLEKGQVTKVTPKGVTVDHKVNIRSERVYMADKGMEALFDGTVVKLSPIDTAEEALRNRKDNPRNYPSYPQFYCGTDENVKPV